MDGSMVEGPTPLSLHHPVPPHCFGYYGHWVSLRTHFLGVFGVKLFLMLRLAAYLVPNLSLDIRSKYRSLNSSFSFMAKSILGLVMGPGTPPGKRAATKISLSLIVKASVFFFFWSFLALCCSLTIKNHTVLESNNLQSQMTVSDKLKYLSINTESQITVSCKWKNQAINNES